MANENQSGYSNAEQLIFLSFYLINIKAGFYK